MITNPFRGICVVCGSEYRVPLRTLNTQRSRQVVTLYFCLHCHSMSCPSDYVETDDILMGPNVSIHVDCFEMKKPMWSRLATWLASFGARGPCADVGCGLGGLVVALNEVVGQACGFDVNPYIVSTGKKMCPDVPLVCGTIGWGGQSYGLVTCVDVMEHIKEPLKFMTEITSCMKPEGLFYTSVPRVNEQDWSLLKDPRETDTDSLFHDVDVHVTHYSTRGLIELGKRVGLKLVCDSASGGWPVNGMLFKKTHS